ncbi:MAG: hypothetical protein KME32_19170 [Mojavia pulchra JT2-VF2]|uniref:Uncharacterized protein n=1 Tax=Mojavia pulchra JT2-VF2 TaxID=287848 RepID=A0A951Q1S9_9NOST|nr:hypothetical protein [Mojavia pulchra JT2-VF2]
MGNPTDTCFPAGTLTANKSAKSFGSSFLGATDGYAGVSRHFPQVGEPAHGGGSPSGASGAKTTVVATADASYVATATLTPTQCPPQRAASPALNAMGYFFIWKSFTPEFLKLGLQDRL